MKLNRLFLSLPIAAFLALAVPAIALGHTGHITSSSSCETGSVTVSLDHNTTADRTVTVTTTIPGTAGIAGAHFDTSYGEIWSASGPQPFAGTVTLTIDAGTSQEFQTSKTITAHEPCETPEPTPPPEPTPTPGCEQSEEGCPTPTPEATPTAGPTGSVIPAKTHRPSIPMPPTSSADQVGMVIPSDDIATPTLLFALGLAFVLLLPSLRRRLDR